MSEEGEKKLVNRDMMKNRNRDSLELMTMTDDDEKEKDPDRLTDAILP